ncbi:membrane associated secretion system protein [Photobacterium japonica]|uniref:tight adherence pilus pseudopilin TadF n=1 Tax=Photobacterium japonica TaxID=2910235 RepID=UPI003D14E782
MMRSNRSRPFRLSRQRGAFAIELVFVLFALCAIFLFTTDLTHKLLLRSQLDRTSFALVNILKERIRYYSVVEDGERIARYTLNQADSRDMQILAARMLNVPHDDVAIKLEALINNVPQPAFTSAQFDQWHCQPTTPISRLTDLSPVDGGKIFPLYQVTLCSQAESWFLPFLGERDASATITSSSVIAGR